MEQVNAWKCDFCKKTSSHKSSISKHEKKCFHNPETRSCATCLWFSGTLGMWPTECLVGVKFKDNPDELKTKLRTQCDDWNNAELMEDFDIFSNKELIQLLITGKRELIKVLEKYPK